MALHPSIRHVDDLRARRSLDENTHTSASYQDEMSTARAFALSQVHIPWVYIEDSVFEDLQSLWDYLLVLWRTM